MMKKKYVLGIFQFILLLSTSSCECKWNGEVSFAVEGTISDVDIEYYTDEIYENLDSVSLPWYSENISAHAEDQEYEDCYISVKNNTTDTSPITVKIYVDGELRAEETGSGANCTVSTGYTIDEFE